MTPDEDPLEFFRARGFELTIRFEGTEWWADLVGRELLVPEYGRGESARAAQSSARRRWLVEQEAPDLRRRIGDPLP